MNGAMVCRLDLSPLPPAITRGGPVLVAIRLGGPDPVAIPGIGRPSGPFNAIQLIPAELYEGG